MKKLHPAMKAHAKAVTQAHAHLSKTVPGFTQLHPHERIRQTQAHVKKQKSGGY